MMKIFLKLVLFGLFLALPAQAQIDYNQEGLDCWDVCVFEAAEDSKSQIALDKLYGLITRIRHMRIFTGVNATAILIDSSIFPKHFNEPDKGGIFEFQQNLAALISFTTPADETDHPVFIVQFDGDQAWYCDTWGCNGRCEGADTALYDIEDVLASTSKGHIEDACYLAAKAIINEPCGGTNRNPLLLAITNSEFDDHVMRRHHYKDSSCKRFKHRMMIGTHFSDDSNNHQVSRFASSKHNALEIKFNETPSIKAVLSNMVECMSQECCPQGRRRKKRSAPVCERTVAGYEKGFDSFQWSK